MFWAVVLFLYYYGLLVLAPEHGWSILGDSSSQRPFEIGFWRSCMEGPGFPGPQGGIPADLNDAAANYVATVYGHRQLPKWLRKSWAISVMILVAGMYGFSIALLADAPLEVLFWVFLVALISGILSGAFTLLAFLQSRSLGIPWSKRRLAIQEIKKIRQQPNLSAILDTAVQRVGASSIIWWRYPQEKGRFFRYAVQLAAITLPAAYAVIAFFQANVHAQSVFPVQGVWGTLLILLTMAVEWVLLVSALIWYGEWKGACGSTRVTFPLRILLNDVEDLAG